MDGIYTITGHGGLTKEKALKTGFPKYTHELIVKFEGPFWVYQLKSSFPGATASGALIVIIGDKLGVFELDTQALFGEWNDQTKTLANNASPKQIRMTADGIAFKVEDNPLYKPEQKIALPE